MLDHRLGHFDNQVDQPHSIPHQLNPLVVVHEAKALIVHLLDDPTRTGVARFFNKARWLRLQQEQTGGLDAVS